MNLNKIIFATILTACAAVGYAQENPKTGYTNIEFIISKVPETKKITDALEIRRKEYEKAYQEKVKNLQDKLAAYQKAGATMPEIIKKDKEKEMETLQASIQEFQQTADNDIQSLQNALLQPLYTKIYKAIQDVAEENKYQFIFNTGDGNAVRHVLVAPANDDVSELVIKKLAVESKAEESKAKAATKETTKAAETVKSTAKPAATTQAAKAKPAAKTPAKKPAAKKK